MFTGLVEGTGDVLAVEARPDGRRLRLRVPRDLGPVQVGESLAVDGVCLTVAALSGGDDGDGLVA
ncbi:MAG: riboflavin synthase, partial [Armatimonadota bacterium]|nr:riboflavin synthase [Armatimonadota bacterium]